MSCGTYSLPGGTGSSGGTSNSSGGASSSSDGGTSSTSNGGTTSSTNGGSTSTSNGGVTGSSDGGSANGGTTSSTNGGSSNGGTTSSSSGGTTSSTSGGSANGGTSTASGGTASSTSGGTTTTTSGGTTSTSGGSTSGGRASGGTTTSAGGTTTGTGGMTGTGGATSTVPLPCEVLKTGGQTCVAAHSTVRVLVTGYTGPLYQVCKGTFAAGPSSCKGTTQDIAAVNGYANAAAQDTFCSGGSCTITKIYDQSGQGNHLEPAPRGGAKPTADNPANATDLKVTVGGHAAYGVFIKPGMGYRTGCSACNIKTGNGTATGDAAETQYMLSSQKNLVNGCCFDYGNAETTSNDDGNGTMEAVYLGLGVVWGTGVQGGPWVMADLENGLYAGWENNQDKNISTNTPLKYDYVNAVVVGDTRDKNSNKGRFALYGGDATTGVLKTMYDGIRPAKPGYVPMLKQGSIILGIGGDNSGTGGGYFYEGVMANGAATKATVDALQAAIVAAQYGK
ncbi:MAG: arabinofuranosidase catalytic domain-containing protein [Polyangiaceae bacterium]